MAARLDGIILPLAVSAVVDGHHAVDVPGATPAHYPLVSYGGLKEADAPLRGVLFSVGERGGVVDDCC